MKAWIWPLLFAHDKNDGHWLPRLPLRDWPMDSGTRSSDTLPWHGTYLKAMDSTTHLTKCPHGWFDGSLSAPRTTSEPMCPAANSGTSILLPVDTTECTSSWPCRAHFRTGLQKQPLWCQYLSQRLKREGGLALSPCKVNVLTDHS